MDSNRTGTQLTPDEYKEEVKKVLAAIHDICSRRNIPYFIAFGTMLGAVRHKGFIPWDDDIDIIMTRDNYERFCQILPEETDDYYVLSGDTSPYYYFYFSRVCSRTAVLKLKGILDLDNLGPFVDIFILDKTSEDPIERAAHNKEVMALNQKIKYALPARYYRTLPKKRRIRMLLNLPKRIDAGLIKGFKKIRKEREEIIQRYRGSDSRLYTTSYDPIQDKCLYYEDEIEELVLTDFEDIKVYMPAAYDTLLTRRYGDYMQLPPVEQRVTHHHFVPVWN